MEVEGITFTLNTVLSILFGAAGATGVWFSLKGQVAIMRDQIRFQQREIIEMKKDIKDNREHLDSSITIVTKEIHEMELRIIKAINELK